MNFKATKLIILLAAFALVAFVWMNRALVPALAACRPPSRSSATSGQSWRRGICRATARRSRSGGLRLDARSFALRGGHSGPALVAGKAAESRLYQRVGAPDGEQMPPVGERLSAAEVARLKAWIDARAVWEGDEQRGRMNLRRIGRGGRFDGQRPPTTNHQNPIDAFIAAKLAEKGLAMSAEAERRV